MTRRPYPPKPTLLSLKRRVRVLEAENKELRVINDQQLRRINEVELRSQYMSEQLARYIDPSTQEAKHEW